jgi:hypothetical protein
MIDSTKSLPDKMEDLADSFKALEDMGKNIEEDCEMIRKALHDRRVANTLFRKRLEDRKKLIAKIREDYVETDSMRDSIAKINDMQDDLDTVDKMAVDYDKDWAIEEAKDRLDDEQIEMLRKKREDFETALR